jgi:hypothetical protein
MTQKRATPTAKRRRVGAQLRRYREDVPLKSGDAAKLMKWDTTRLSRIERGLYRVSGDEVRELIDKYGVDDPVAVDEIAAAAEEPPGAGWWSSYPMSTPYRDFVELEADSETIRIVNPVVIPGPVQTHGYAREIITRSAHPETEQRAEQLVSIRMARQEILYRPVKPVKLQALIPQSALHAEFETAPVVMKEQLRKLLDVSELPNVTIQIIPVSAHPAFVSNGAVTILTFRHPWAPVVSIDNPMGGDHSEDQRQVAYMEAVFEQTASIALPVDKSRDLLTEYLDGLRK